jgi:hypothetical protein
MAQRVSAPKLRRASGEAGITWITNSQRAMTLGCTNHPARTYKVRRGRLLLSDGLFCLPPQSGLGVILLTRHPHTDFSISDLQNIFQRKFAAEAVE